MPDLPTRAQLADVFADELLTRAELRPVGDRITPEQVYTPGSDINLIMAGSAAMGEEIVRTAGRATADLTLDGAEGEALDRWVADRYSPTLVRKSAAPAQVTLSITRTSIAAGAVPYSSGSVVQTDGGVRFELLADAPLGASSLGPVTVAAEAVEAGTSGNVAANTITSFITQPPDSTMLVTNPDVAAGGAATETDESLKSRARLFYQQARRGTLAAIEFGALTVPGVAQATAEEQLNSLGVPNGLVFLYISDANGQSNALLEAAVADALLEYRGGGIVVDVFGAVPVLQSIVLSLSYTAGTDTAAAFNSVRAAVVAAVNALAPGDTLYRSIIIEAAKSITGVIVSDTAVTVPTGDVVPTSGQVIRTSKDIVTTS
jgi:uncharacterized phage protein gp47/JayE